jgi:hypothetical protein
VAAGVGVAQRLIAFVAMVATGSFFQSRLFFPEIEKGFAS